MKRTNILSIIGIIAIIGIIPLYIYHSHITPPKPVTVIDYQYKTDTVYADTVFIPGDPYPVLTDPKVITYYISDSSALDSLNLLLQEKDIVIAGLEDSIRIHENYLKQFPYNPKLLAIDLRRDTLALGLLKITGQTQSEIWPIDLTQFNYRWNYSASLSRHPVELPPTLKEPFANYFVGGGVDLLWRSPYVSGKIEKNWTHIRLYGSTDLEFLDISKSSIKLGIDYKINGKSRIRTE